MTFGAMNAAADEPAAPAKSTPPAPSTPAAAEPTPAPDSNTPVPASPAPAPDAAPAPAAAPSAAEPAPAPPPPPLVAFPHPLISEVLAAVPTGSAGDANKDGTRDATGDEFVEIFNPHDKPIELRGYRLTDKSLGKSKAWSFTFPQMELKPGEVCVVFNGCKATIPAPVGDESNAAGPNPKFDGARVFTMNAPSTRISLSNATDSVVVWTPDGRVVEVVKWGKVEGLPACSLTQEVSAVTDCSLQRDTLTGKLVAHRSEGGVSFSPGKFAPAAALRSVKPATGNGRTPGPAADKQPGTRPSPKSGGGR